MLVVIVPMGTGYEEGGLDFVGDDDGRKIEDCGRVGRDWSRIQKHRNAGRTGYAHRGSDRIHAGFELQDQHVAGRDDIGGGFDVLGRQGQVRAGKRVDGILPVIQDDRDGDAGAFAGID